MTLYDDAMRTIIDLPDQDLRDLAEISQREKISRAEVIRRAVRLYVERLRPAREQAVFGLWRGRKRDGLHYEDKLRREWDKR